MSISIAERLRPFSHIPGNCCLLPKSLLRCTAFPTHLIIEDFSETKPKLIAKIEFDLKGPVRGFTLCQDLEKEKISIWGHYQEGFVSYCLEMSNSQDTLEFKLERGSTEGVFISNLNKKIHVNESLTFSVGPFFQKFEYPFTRLSLGSHKAQDIDLIKRRADLVEIFPLWFRLGKSIPVQTDNDSNSGNWKLLDACRRVVVQENHQDIYQTFLNLFLAGFEGMLSPRLYDTDYQGFGVNPPEDYKNVSAAPLNILTESALLIEKLFFAFDGSHAKILPLLPSEFHAGRMLNVSFGEFGELDLEWSKKTIRRMSFRAKKEGEIFFLFQKPLKSFRLRSFDQKKQKSAALVPVDQPLHCLSGYTYFFDRFLK